MTLPEPQKSPRLHRHALVRGQVVGQEGDNHRDRDAPGQGLSKNRAIFTKWMWVKITPPGDRRFWSMFPLARVPFGVPILDPAKRLKGNWWLFVQGGCLSKDFLGRSP